MDGSNLIFIVMPIVMAACLGVMIALPYIGGRQEARAAAADRRAGAGAITATTPPNVPAAGAPLSAAPITVTLEASPESPAEENRST